MKTGKVFNNKKVSDHHAIIPTGASIAKLDEMEAKLYHMVAQRLVAVFYTLARFDLNTPIKKQAGGQFKSDRKNINDTGFFILWLVLM